MTRAQLYATCRHYLGKSFCYSKVNNQIDEYISTLGLTLDQIAQTLYYWYDIKGSNPAKAGGGIGIVPYIYSEALRYFEQQEETKKMIDSVGSYEAPQTETFSSVPPPFRRAKSLKLFDLS